MPLKAKFQKIMRERKLNQTELAEAIGCDPRKLGMVLSRDSAKSALVPLASDNLKIPLTWFFESDDTPLPPSVVAEQPSRFKADDVDVPPSIEEQEMQEELGARRLVKAWKALPENERDDALEAMEVKAMRYRSRKRDHQLKHLAATKEGAAAREKLKTSKHSS